MAKSQMFYLFLTFWGILYGISVFIPDRVLLVLSGVAAIITGVLAFTLAF